MDRYYLPPIADTGQHCAHGQIVDVDHVYGALLSPVEGHRRVIELQIGAPVIGLQPPLLDWILRYGSDARLGKRKH